MLDQELELQSKNSTLEQKHINNLVRKAKNIGQTNLDVLKSNNTYFVDSSRTDIYVADGTKHKPFKSLNTALTSKLQGTATVVFYLAPGIYSGVISITKSVQDQSFSIIGQDAQSTIIQGGTAWDHTRGNVLYFRKFNDITVKNVTIELGAYGIYTRTCRRVSIEDVRLRYLGTSDNSANWNFQDSQATRQSVWAGNSTSDGGAMRIRDTQVVQIKGCEVTQTLRGIRIQQASRGIISNCRTHLTVESGVYLASSDYAYTNACNNFLITGCIVEDAMNNGILVIGGSNNSVIGNQVIGSANAGIQCWSVKDVCIKSNKLHNCNRLAHNGIGNGGDAWGNIVVDGNNSVPDEAGYLADISDNSLYNCNQGRQSSVIGVNIRSDTYPSSCNKCYVSNNVTDATSKIYNTFKSFPVVRKTADVASLKIDGTAITSTAAQLNYVDATSSIQTQLNTSDSKVTAVETILGNRTATQLSYLDAASSIQTQINGLSGGSGIQAADDVTWSGNHTFTGDVSIAQPLVRAPMTVVTTANTVNSKLVLSKDVAAYLYNHPNIQSTADNTNWQLPSNAEVGTRIAIFAYTGGEQNGRVMVYTDGTQKLYQVNSSTNKGSSGVTGKKNGKSYFTMIIAGTNGVWTT